MNITAADVNKLRQVTGAGMMDCKKALTETGGDFDSAIDYLRKKGQKVSANRAERVASEGLVVAKTSDDQRKGVLVELNCETDFVAKNADFNQVVTNFANAALEYFPANLDELKQVKLDGKTIDEIVTEQVGKIGEKIELSKYEKIESDTVIAYNHLGNKIGVLVALNQPFSTEIEEAGKDVAMQIAAMNPLAVDKDQVDERTIQREIEIAKEQIIAEGKPAEMAEKIAQGKLNKFFKENTLLNQDYVKDSSKTVKQRLTEAHNNLTVKEFKRVEIGR